MERSMDKGNCSMRMETNSSRFILTSLLGLEMIINLFRGHWHEDKATGSGTLEQANGDLYDGEWLNDHRHGRCDFKCRNHVDSVVMIGCTCLLRSWQIRF